MRFNKDWKQFRKGEDASKLSRAMMSLARFRGVVDDDKARKEDKLPTKHCKKEYIMDYLQRRGYAVDNSLTKTDLLTIIDTL